MSSNEEFDALALAKLEEHYVAAGEPEEIDEAFASAYFESVAAASSGPVIPLPGKAVANFLKESEAFVNLKFEEAHLKFGTPQSGDWPFLGRGVVFGTVVPGQKGFCKVEQVNKLLLIRIKNEGEKTWDGGLARVESVGEQFIGVAWSPIATQSGIGTWEKL